MAAEKTVKIIFVCLGNICRSPMAQFVAQELAKREAPALEIVCDSAGTSGWNDGEEMHRETRKQLERHSIPIGNFRSKKLTEELVEANDWIVVMDKSNKRDVLREFGSLAEGKTVLATDLLTRQRYAEVPDPWYTKNFDETYSILAEAISAMMKALNEGKGLIGVPAGE